MKRIFSWALAFGLACSSPLANGQDCDSSFLGSGSGAACGSCDSAGYATCECGAAVCDLGCGHSGWYAGVEATYLAPLYGQDFACFTLVDVPTRSRLQVRSDFDTAEELTGAPRVVLGYTDDCGVGIQARYWELNNAISDTALPLPITGNQIQHLGGEDSFEAYTIDLELTKPFTYRGLNLFGTLGARHASIDHTRANRVLGGMNGDIISLGSQQSEQFNGTGFTTSLSSLTPFRRCRGLSFYTTGRTSVVFGEADTLATATALSAGPGGNNGLVNGQLNEDDEAMFISEIGAGLQWSRCVRSFKGRMFARLGVEYQYWDASDANAAWAVAAAGTPGSSKGIAQAESDGDHEYHLIGLSAMTGFNW